MKRLLTLICCFFIVANAEEKIKFPKIFPIEFHPQASILYRTTH